MVCKIMNPQSLTHNVSLDNSVKYGKRSQSVYAVHKLGGVVWIVAFAGVQCRCANHKTATEIAEELAQKRESGENHQAILKWLIAESL